MADGQSQKAGPNANQYQIQGDLNVYQGVTRDEAVAIAKTTSEFVLAEYDARAGSKGFLRIGDFNDRFVGKLVQASMLDALSDPAFQVLLKKAQIGAASSGRESDYDMLAGLLVDKAQRGGDRRVGAAIDRAVQVVDLLDNQALAGLTAIQAFSQYLPVSGSIEDGLDALEGLFEQLETHDLPSGTDWIDHLEILGLVRILEGNTVTRRPAREIWERKTPGYATMGVHQDEAPQALQRHAEQSPQIQVQLENHPLKPGFRRIAAPYAESLSSALISVGVEREVVDRYVQSLRENFKVDTVDPEISEQVYDHAAKRPTLGIIQAWWDTIAQPFQVTGVGKVIGRADAERLDVKGILPPLN